MNYTLNEEKETVVMFDLTTIQLMNLAASVEECSPRKAITPEVVRKASFAVKKTADKFCEPYVEVLDGLAKECG